MLYSNCTISFVVILSQVVVVVVEEDEEDSVPSSSEGKANAVEKSTAEPPGVEVEVSTKKKSPAGVRKVVNVSVRVNAIDAGPSGDDPEPVARVTTPPPTRGASSSGGPAPPADRARRSPVPPGTTPGVWTKSNLNLAPRVQIMRTPQIGENLTRDLVERRPFKTWAEVGSMTGIGPVRLANLQERFFLPSKEVSDPEESTKDEAPRRGRAMVVTMNRPAVAATAAEQSPAEPPPPNNFAGGSTDRRQKRAEQATIKGVECEVPARHFIDHTPKDPNCPVCSNAKYQKSPHRRNIPQDDKKHGIGEAVDESKLTKLGEIITADHIVLGSEADHSRLGDTATLVVYDRGTQDIASYPAPTKSGDDTLLGFQEFVGPKDTVELIYSDVSGEIAKACRTMKWRQDTSCPHRPESNGVAEAAVRRVVEATRCALLQSGLSHKFWAEAAKCATANLSINPPIDGGPAPYERRHGEPFPGHILPFGLQDHASFPQQGTQGPKVRWRTRTTS